MIRPIVNRTLLTAYIETTVPSYLIARRSRDIIVLGHQETTQIFWETAPRRYELVISEAVLEELRGGDAAAAAERLRAIAELPVLQPNETVSRLAEFYRRLLKLPDQAATDAVHLAFAVAYEIDYVVTWNLRHLANGEVQRRITEANDARNLHVPLIVTPEALLDELPPMSESQDV